MKFIYTRIFSRIVLCIFLLLFSLLASISGYAASDDLLASLRKGGYILYFRHAHTEWSQSDRVNGPDDWQSCDSQRMRQLSDRGREVARRVGEHIRRLGIPVGEIFASEYCRTHETATLLGLGTVQITRDILNDRVADHIGGMETLKQRAQRRLSTPPSAGTNTILVAHGNVFVLAGGRRPVEAGAAVVKPDATGGFTIVDYINPEDWETY